MSEQDIARLRVVVDEIVERARLTAYQLEMAARDYEYATIYYHLASVEFAHAAQNYEIAAGKYEQIASFIITAASSKGFLRRLCGRSVNEKGFGELLNAYGAKFDEKSIDQLIPRLLGEQGAGPTALHGKPLDLPLSAMNPLAKRATQMLLCAK